ncbi:cell division protein FtsB [Orbaceae bacterium ac157xtp]
MISKWKLPILLSIVLCYLQYALWFGKNNVFDYQQNKNTVEQYRKENAQLKMRNEQMFAEIEDLYDGYEAIEERARNQLGMIRADEHFYRIINDANVTE